MKGQVKLQKYFEFDDVNSCKMYINWNINARHPDWAMWGWIPQINPLKRPNMRESIG